MSTLDSDVPCVLAIGGLDPSGGAGLPADARAIAAFKAHCCGITTAVIAQNTRGVALLEAVPPHLLAAQLDNLLEDVTPRAVKIGMLPDLASVKIVAERLAQLQGIPVVIDTVFAPSNGPRFVDDETVAGIIEYLFPLADLVTPNIPEATRLCGAPITDAESMAVAARRIHEHCGARHVLVKGGHAHELTAPEGIAPDVAADKNAGRIASDSVDVLFDGRNLVELRAPRVVGYEVRGTGCLLASAIAAQQAHGTAIEEAARRAKSWLTGQIRSAKIIGHGRRVAI